ncbi:hypothetical protein NAP1_12308 [Erythrobacter sp. NAP1]|nr:hypothetical protein NAP1_12308 [Erythrobacter sp. NAP1]
MGSVATRPQGRPAARSDAIFDRMSEEVARPDGRAQEQ